MSSRNSFSIRRLLTASRRQSLAETSPGFSHGLDDDIRRCETPDDTVSMIEWRPSTASSSGTAIAREAVGVAGQSADKTRPRPAGATGKLNKRKRAGAATCGSSKSDNIDKADKTDKPGNTNNSDNVTNSSKAAKTSDVLAAAAAVGPDEVERIRAVVTAAAAAAASSLRLADGPESLVDRAERLADREWRQMQRNDMTNSNDDNKGGVPEMARYFQQSRSLSSLSAGNNERRQRRAAPPPPLVLFAANSRRGSPADDGSCRGGRSGPDQYAALFHLGSFANSSNSTDSTDSTDSTTSTATVFTLPFPSDRPSSSSSSFTLTPPPSSSQPVSAPSQSLPSQSWQSSQSSQPSRSQAFPLQPPSLSYPSQTHPLQLNPPKPYPSQSYSCQPVPSRPVPPQPTPSQPVPPRPSQLYPQRFPSPYLSKALPSLPPVPSQPSHPPPLPIPVRGVKLRPSLSLYPKPLFSDKAIVSPSVHPGTRPSLACERPAMDLDVDGKCDERSPSDDKQEASGDSTKPGNDSSSNNNNRRSSSSSRRNSNDHGYLFNFPEGPCLDLFEALTIQPEEANVLRQQYQASTQQQKPQPAKDNKTKNKGKGKGKGNVNGNKGIRKSNTSTSNRPAPHFPVVSAALAPAANINNTADVSVNPNKYRFAAADVASSDSFLNSPTFTHPRPAPLPGSGRGPMTPPYTPPAATSTALALDAPAAATGRFTLLPRRLRGASTASAATKSTATEAPASTQDVLSRSSSRVQRKKPSNKKKIGRDRAGMVAAVAAAAAATRWTDRTDSGSCASLLSQTSSTFAASSATVPTSPPPPPPGSDAPAAHPTAAATARKAFPGNVADLLNSRLFSRIEVDEMLSPDTLQAIRTSRSTAVTPAKAEAGTKEAEAKEPESKKTQVKADTNSEEAHIGVANEQVRPAEQSITSLPTPPTPPTQTVTTTLTMPQRATDDMETPVEPFHLEGLPSRIGKAGVRVSGVSVLLPVEEEAASFNVAPRKLAKAAASESWLPPPPAAAAAPGSTGPFLRLATRLPLHFQLPSLPSLPSPAPLTPLPVPSARAAAATAAVGIPRLTLTDTDSNNSRPVVVPATPVAPALAVSPLSPDTLVLPQPQQRQKRQPRQSQKQRQLRRKARLPVLPDNDANYVYLQTTPYSLVMPTFRHGPIRLARADLVAAAAAASMHRSGSSHQFGGFAPPPPISPDDILDWTAFQMAILGGAGDFFSDSIDYGRTSQADVDEQTELALWWGAMGFREDERRRWAEDDEAAPRIAENTERFTAADDSDSDATEVVELEASVPPLDAPLAPPLAQQTPACVDGSQICPYSRSTSPLRVANPETASWSAIFAVASAPSAAGDTSSDQLAGQVTNQVAELVAELEAISVTRPTVTIRPAFRNSFDDSGSFKSLPESPLGDIPVLSPLEDGGDSRTAVPMGYNLGHDLDTFLRWETENVCAMKLD